MRAAHPFVGRADELTVVDRALDGQDPAGVVLVGPAGVGKTRMAREALVRAQQRGRTTFWVAASKAAASIPFGAVAHLMPEVDTSDRLRLLHRAEQWLAGATHGGAAVLGVDDAHDLDDASATLVQRVAESGAALVVATVRAGATVPDPVTALWKDGHGERVELGPLDRPDTERLVEAVLGGVVDGVAREQLWHLSRGNALYLHELVRGGLASGALSWRTGVWCWAGRVAAAPHLLALIDARIGALSPAIRDAVDTVALGEPLGTRLLARAGVELTAIAEAEGAGLLRTEPSPHDIDVRLAHPLFGEAARARASPLRRRELCRRLARAAGSPEGRDTPADDPVRVATWHLDGGALEADVLARGARRALAALDLELAQRLADGAVQAGGGTEARRLLATVMVLRGDSAAAETILGGLDTAGLPDRARAEVAAFRAWNLLFGLGRREESEQVLTDTEASIVAGRELLDVQRAVAHGYAGRVPQALALARSVIDRPAADPGAVARALTLTCQSAGMHGQYRDALRAGLRATDLDQRLHGGDWSMATEETRAGSVSAHLYAGDLATAQCMVDASVRRVAASGWHPGVAMWMSWQSDLAFMRGQIRTALGHIREATALAARDLQPFRCWASRLRALQRARTTALLGEISEAEEALAEAEHWDDGDGGLLDAWGGSSAAWVAAARGEVSAAVALALEAAERARRDEQFGWELVTLHQVVRLGAPEQATARLAELGRRVDGRLAPLYVDHGRAAATGDGEGLDAVAAGFADLGCLLLAAEASARAARVHRSSGRTGRSMASGARARHLAARCEGVRTLALAELVEPDGLTRRENEIARLAASGLTNRAIADKLVVSVRTVDNTLHQVYTKLGVAGRAELPVLFTEPPRR